MLYVEQSLGPEEELVHVGAFHWMYTLQAFMSIVWGMVISLMIVVGAVFIYKKMGWFPPDLPLHEGIQYLHPGVRIGAFVAFVLGLLSFAQMMVIKATTEIAITNTRLVYKRGLVARHVGEMSIDRIEGVNVLQTILGRIFNYGRLAIRGMGIGEVVLPPIEDPITFRQAIEKARAI
ncbi:MAG: PH domain-containing protein [Alphaproteobacteria bacterium]|nr:PH domain-containing protein [Alphaproteobacteria bacterium]